MMLEDMKYALIKESNRGSIVYVVMGLYKIISVKTLKLKFKEIRYD